MLHSSTSGSKTIECPLYTKSHKFLSVLAFCDGLPRPLLLTVCRFFCFVFPAEKEGGLEAVVTPATWGLPPSWLPVGLARASAAPLAQWLPRDQLSGSLWAPCSSPRSLCPRPWPQASLRSPRWGGCVVVAVVRWYASPGPGGRPPARPGWQPQEEERVPQVGWTPGQAGWVPGPGRCGGGRCWGLGSASPPRLAGQARQPREGATPSKVPLALLLVFVSTRRTPTLPLQPRSPHHWRPDPVPTP